MKSKTKIAGIIGAIALVAIPSCIYLANRQKTEKKVTQQTESKTPYVLQSNQLQDQYSSLEKKYTDLLKENSKLKKRESELVLRLNDLDTDFNVFKAEYVTRKEYTELLIKKERVDIQRLENVNHYLEQRNINQSLEDENKQLKYQNNELSKKVDEYSKALDAALLMNH
jgi:hypothetical protein